MKNSISKYYQDALNKAKKEYDESLKEYSTKHQSKAFYKRTGKIYLDKLDLYEAAFFISYGNIRDEIVI